MFQLQCKGILAGRNGICYSYEGRPMVPVLIKCDLTGEWRETYFLVDTGADETLLHFHEALKLGLNIGRYDPLDFVEGIGGGVRVYYKKGILVKIGHFPPFLLTIGFSPDVMEGLRVLGRRTILNLFGIAFNDKEIGIFTNRKI